MGIDSFYHPLDLRWGLPKNELRINSGQAAYQAALATRKARP